MTSSADSPPPPLPRIPASRGWTEGAAAPTTATTKNEAATPSSSASTLLPCPSPAWIDPSAFSLLARSPRICALLPSFHYRRHCFDYFYLANLLDLCVKEAAQKAAAKESRAQVARAQGRTTVSPPPAIHGALALYILQRPALGSKQDGVAAGLSPTSSALESDLAASFRTSFYVSIRTIRSFFFQLRGDWRARNNLVEKQLKLHLLKKKKEAREQQQQQHQPQSTDAALPQIPQRHQVVKSTFKQPSSHRSRSTRSGLKNVAANQQESAVVQRLRGGGQVSLSPTRSLPAVPPFDSPVFPSIMIKSVSPMTSDTSSGTPVSSASSSSVSSTPATETKAPLRLSSPEHPLWADFLRLCHDLQSCAQFVILNYLCMWHLLAGSRDGLTLAAAPSPTPLPMPITTGAVPPDSLACVSGKSPAGSDGHALDERLRMQRAEYASQMTQLDDPLGVADGLVEMIEELHVTTQLALLALEGTPLTTTTTTTTTGQAPEVTSRGPTPPTLVSSKSDGSNRTMTSNGSNNSDSDGSQKTSGGISSSSNPSSSPLPLPPYAPTPIVDLNFLSPIGGSVASSTSGSSGVGVGELVRASSNGSDPIRSTAPEREGEMQRTHTCNICDALAVCPILLAVCRHTYCLACLLTHPSFGIQCPTCRILPYPDLIKSPNPITACSPKPPSTARPLVLNQTRLSLETLLFEHSASRWEEVAQPSRHRRRSQKLASAGGTKVVSPASMTTASTTPTMHSLSSGGSSTMSTQPVSPFLSTVPFFFTYSPSTVATEPNDASATPPSGGDSTTSTPESLPRRIPGTTISASNTPTLVYKPIQIGGGPSSNVSSTHSRTHSLLGDVQYYSPITGSGGANWNSVRSITRTLASSGNSGSGDVMSPPDSQRSPSPPAAFMPTLEAARTLVMTLVRHAKDELSETHRALAELDGLSTPVSSVRDDLACETQKRRRRVSRRADTIGGGRDGSSAVRSESLVAMRSKKRGRVVADDDDDEDEEEGRDNDHEDSSPEGRASSSTTSESIASASARLREAAIISTVSNEKGTSCHQCKVSKYSRELLFCQGDGVPTTPKSTRKGRACAKKYCFQCMQRLYHEVLTEQPPNWRCPSCRGLCVCANCSRKQGRKTLLANVRDAAVTSPTTSKAGSKESTSTTTTAMTPGSKKRKPRSIRASTPDPNDALATAGDVTFAIPSTESASIGAITFLATPAGGSTSASAVSSTTASPHMPMSRTLASQQQLQPQHQSLPLLPPPPVTQLVAPETPPGTVLSSSSFSYDAMRSHHHHAHHHSHHSTLAVSPRVPLRAHSDGSLSGDYRSQQTRQQQQAHPQYPAAAQAGYSRLSHPARVQPYGDVHHYPHASSSASIVHPETTSQQFALARGMTSATSAAITSDHAPVYAHHHHHVSSSFDASAHTPPQQYRPVVPLLPLVDPRQQYPAGPASSASSRSTDLGGLSDTIRSMVERDDRRVQQELEHAQIQRFLGLAPLQQQPQQQMAPPQATHPPHLASRTNVPVTTPAADPNIEASLRDDFPAQPAPNGTPAASLLMPPVPINFTGTPLQYMSSAQLLDLPYHHANPTPDDLTRMREEASARATARAYERERENRSRTTLAGTPTVATPQMRAQHPPPSPFLSPACVTEPLPPTLPPNAVANGSSEVNWAAVQRILAATNGGASSTHAGSGVAPDSHLFAGFNGHHPQLRHPSSYHHDLHRMPWSANERAGNHEPVSENERMAGSSSDEGGMPPSPSDTRDESPGGTASGESNARELLPPPPVLPSPTRTAAVMPVGSVSPTLPSVPPPRADSAMDIDGVPTEVPFQAFDALGPFSSTSPPRIRDISANAGEGCSPSSEIPMAITPRTTPDSAEPKLATPPAPQPTPLSTPLQPLG